MHEYREILDFRPLLTKKGEPYKTPRWEVLLKWDDGSQTWESLDVIAETDHAACALFASDKVYDGKRLVDQPGWQRFKKLAAKKKKLFRLVQQAKLRSNRTRPIYQYGVQVPRNHNEAVHIDTANSNTLWQDAERTELAQLDEYEAFKDLGKGAPAPNGYKKIRVHFVYACKHDGRRKARLVAGGHLTDTPVDSVYSSVVSLRVIRTVTFLSELNGLELWGTDIGNAYLESVTKEKVHITVGPEFGERAGHTIALC